MGSKESASIREALFEQQKAAQSGPQLSLKEKRKKLDEAGLTSALDIDVQVEKTSIAGVSGEWISTPNAEHSRVLLYLHGGAYYLGSCNSHRYLASRLSRATSLRTLVIEYRLAPENPFPFALEDAVSVYRALLESGVPARSIVIGGDSAGGGLTMATLLSLRDAGDPLPTAAVLLSPWTDLLGTGKSMHTRAAFDPKLDAAGLAAAAKLYAGDADLRHPLISPVYADLRGMPPMIVHVGYDECLLDDSVRLVENARSAGVKVSFKIWPDMWHVFQTYAKTLPEASESIEEIGLFVRDQFL